MAPQRIAIVDDDTAVCTQAKGELTSAGFEVLCVQDGKAAVEQLVSFRPRVIFLHLTMQRMDCSSFCRQLREIGSLDESKIVFYSTQNFHPETKTASELGADGLFQAPFEPNAFVKKAHALLRQKVILQFWGTRGSIATPSRETVRYGGNTSCVEILLPSTNDLIILDAGTGLRSLGNAKLKERSDWNGSLLISHAHWDHIQGLPFFMPLYIPGNNFTIIAADQRDVPFKDVITGQMTSPYFPLEFSHLASNVDFRRITEGEFTIGDLRVETMTANHPNTTLMFKISLEGKTIIYATDNELEKHTEGQTAASSAEKRRFIEFFRGADLLIHDAQYTEAEYKLKRGWGHSTWYEALDTALRSEVKQLVLFHHDPEHTDDMIDHILVECNEELDKRGIKLPIVAAQEGEQILIDPSTSAG